MKKRLTSVMLAVFMMLGLFMIAHAVWPDEASMYVKQERSSECVFVSCLNMFRRRAMVDGVADWEEITQSNYKDEITTDGLLVRHTITNVKGMDAQTEKIDSKTTEEKKDYLISLLDRHPEGIVIYSHSDPQHAVLLTDYADDVFYCVETLDSYPDEPIPLTDTTLCKGRSQDDTVDQIKQIWYISNKSGGTMPDEVPTPTDGVGLDNFVPVNRYNDGIFRDVDRSDWFHSNVAAVYELGLMKGKGSDTFSPNENVTIAETVTLAARIHSIYYTGTEEFPGYDDGNWYDTYVDYALANGMIDALDDYTPSATREEFVHILARALPEEALENIAGQITFADAADITYMSDVRLLSGAGIINGFQDGGETCFRPTDAITRAQAAAIVGRMAQPDNRVG